VAGGTEGGTGTGGSGAGGTGTGTGDMGAGTGTGNAGGIPAIATRLPTGVTRAMGNIAPYRKDLLVRLAQNWRPKKSYENLIVLITIDHDGKLMGSEIFQSSGSKKADKEALQAVQATEFAPLPEWYKGETLTFKIELSKVESVTQ
jgi:TonB family protein